MDESIYPSVTPLHRKQLGIGWKVVGYMGTPAISLDYSLCVMSGNY